MEKSILHTTKLEISKTFTLVPYERIAFHKIMGILKTENGMNVLLKELYLDPLVRESAISVLKDFNQSEVKQAFFKLLAEKISNEERINILDHIERKGGPEDVGILIKFAEVVKNKEGFLKVASRTFNVLRVIGVGSSELFDYFSKIALEKANTLWQRTLAVVGLSSFNQISIYEELLKENNNEISNSVYKAISLFCKSKNTVKKELADEEGNKDSRNPQDWEEEILKIRVLLGKMTSSFESYDNSTKASFIDAMLSCSHREFLIYTMKAITSKNAELIEIILYLLVSNVSLLRDPDKLFRSLLALSLDKEKENEIIVDIFTGFFSNMPENTGNILMRDKLFNYMAVTLDTYFESYRKDFMVKDVVEKSYSESFQDIRQFVLEKFNPEIKKRIVNYLRIEDNSKLKSLLPELSEKFPFVEEKNKDALSRLIEVLYDNDKKIRENSASRIDSINYEKRYLRDRIVRICKIIGRLNIESTATILVKIFNYVKKYHDPEIFHAVSNALSKLNYSYMLGELEVMLTTGSNEEKERSIQYLCQFSDQRSINIMLDFLKENMDADQHIILLLLKILHQSDLSGNVAANHIMKKIIETTDNTEIKRIAIFCIGKCGEESDIEYLNSQFFTLDTADPKEAIVQALGYIISISKTFNRMEILKYLQEYLKDPSIKVRIYSCSLLIQLGNKGAIKTIQDMMIIKNKNIQREILSIVGRIKSIEIAFFLISLLKEEYAISSDIVPFLKILPEEDLLEIDHFIVNIFKKYEAPDILFGGEENKLNAGLSGAIKNLEQIETTILSINLLDYERIAQRLNLSDITIFFNTIYNTSISEIGKNKGMISGISDGKIIAYFPEPVLAAKAGVQILHNIKEINKTRASKNQIVYLINIITDKVKVLQGEVLSCSEYIFDLMGSTFITKRVIVDDYTKNLIEDDFFCENLSELIFKRTGLSPVFYDLINPINFLVFVEDVVSKVDQIITERQKLQMQVDEELKKSKREVAATAYEYTKAIDNLGNIIKLEVNEIMKYIQKRSTDRELINTADKMLSNLYKRCIVETSKIVFDKK